MTDRESQLDAENKDLREQLRINQEKYNELKETTTAKIQSLIEENEMLAEANRLLMENEAMFKRLNNTCSAKGEGMMNQIPDELLLPGSGLNMASVTSMENLHAAGNLLSVSVPSTHPSIVVTGGVDKHIMVHDWKLQKKLCGYESSAPVLDIAFNPHMDAGLLFIAAFMDASHGLFRLVDNDGTWEIQEIERFHDHTRHGAMRVAWSVDGELFATGASDKSLNIYRCANLSSTGTGLSPSCEKIKTFYFNGTVEALTFIPKSDSTGDHELLAISVRDDCYMHYVDCVTFDKERINMNQDGIEHVSYTMMDLRVSPKGKFLLVATDKDRHFIISIKQNEVLRNLYGHKAGPYSQPRVLWHPSEKYVISNTEESGDIFVWCIASEKVVETIRAHDKLIRSLTITTKGPDNIPMLVTVSYDKRLRVWQVKTEGQSITAT